MGAALWRPPILPSDGRDSMTDAQSSRRSGRPPLLSHHRTCESASGGSPRIPDCRVAFGAAAQILDRPVRAGKRLLHRAGVRHPPRPLLRVALTGMWLGDAEASEHPHASAAALPFLPATGSESSAHPFVEHLERARGLGQGEVAHPATQELVELELEPPPKEPPDTDHRPLTRTAAAHVDVAVADETMAPCGELFVEVVEQDVGKQR